MSAAVEERIEFLTIEEQAHLMETGTLTSRQLVERYLERIEKHRELNAFITVMADEAIAAADQADYARREGRTKGVLHGIPFAVKDQFQISGGRVTGGSRLYAETITDADATAIRKLRQAGAVLLGTLNTHEFHWGPTQDFPFGTPKNPWDASRDPGGSSSGSAIAVAAGLCSFSLGGDTGGSIRAPAALCGVVGLKPTWGRISRQGVFPLSWSLDCVGPLARSVRDVASVLTVVAGQDQLDPTASVRSVPEYTRHLNEDLRRLRIGVVEEMLSDRMVGAEARRAAENALAVLEGQGAKLVPVSLPKMSDTRFILPLIVDSEAYSYHRRALLKNYDAFDVNTRVSAMVGAAMPGGIVAQAKRARHEVAREVHAALESADILFGAGSPGSAPAISKRPPIRTQEDAEEYIFGVGTSAGQLTRVYNLAGVPAMSLPCGSAEDGMPLAIHIAARPFDEQTLFQVGNAFQTKTRWHRNHPAS